MRTLFSFEVIREGEKVKFIVCGDGFLYNMVRIMIGTLLQLSTGKHSAGSIPSILAARNRQQAGFTAPARGLYLSKVTYKEEAFVFHE